MISAGSPRQRFGEQARRFAEQLGWRSPAAPQDALAAAIAEAAPLGMALTGLPAALLAHQRRFPSHGPRCPCSAGVRLQVQEAANALAASGPDGAGAVARLRYVLDAALGTPPYTDSREGRE